MAVRPPGSVEPETDERSEQTTTTEPKHRGVLGFLRELPVLLVVALLLALLIKSLVLQAFYIPSGSMEPTLRPGDRVLVNKVVYHLHPPGRGDVIVFQSPNPAAQPDRGVIGAFLHWLGEGLGLSAPADEDFIKRVIGLPGDTVEIHDQRVFINGKPLSEPYLPAHAMSGVADFAPTRVPAGDLFVMGDNRNNSNDSRFQLGPVPIHDVIGRAFVTIWPPSRIRWLLG